MDFNRIQDKYFNAQLQDAICRLYFCRMFSKEEQAFIKYWEQNRNKQRRFFKQFAIGLPFGVLFAIAMFLNFSSGWDKRVQEITKTYPSFKSLILVLLIALVGIVVFISVFSVKVRWEKYEQRYRELMSRSQSEQQTKSEPKPQP